jgi:DNA-binding transcriptional MerR regulator
MFETFVCFLVFKSYMISHFHSSQVVQLTGITPRQLQWWDEQGIVVPGREGHSRHYSQADLTEVAVICQLRKKGFSLQRVRKVMRLLQKNFRTRLAETVSGKSDYHLLTDGERVYLETSPRQIVDILKNAQQPILAVCVSDEVRRIRATLRTNQINRKAPARSTPRSGAARQLA